MGLLENVAEKEKSPKSACLNSPIFILLTAARSQVFCLFVCVEASGFVLFLFVNIGFDRLIPT